MNHRRRPLQILKKLNALNSTKVVLALEDNGAGLRLVASANFGDHTGHLR